MNYQSSDNTYRLTALPSYRLKWALQDLNLRPTDYESAALTKLS